MPKKIIYSENATTTTSAVVSILKARKKELHYSFQQMQDFSTNTSMQYTTIYRYFNKENQIDLLTFFELCRILDLIPFEVLKLASDVVKKDT